LSSGARSIFFQFPVDKKGDEFQSIAGFTPRGFLRMLDLLNENYLRLIPQFGNI
jgi:hypothetical protein